MRRAELRSATKGAARSVGMKSSDVGTARRAHLTSTPFGFNTEHLEAQIISHSPSCASVSSCETLRHSHYLICPADRRSHSILLDCGASRPVTQQENSPQLSSMQRHGAGSISRMLRIPTTRAAYTLHVCQHGV